MYGYDTLWSYECGLGLGAVVCGDSQLNVIYLFPGGETFNCI